MANQIDALEMTREEYQALRDELEILKTVRRDEVSEKIRVARGFGDLSENSEYDEAKNDQAQLEARIQRLEEQLKNVSIIELISTDCVTVGTKVVLRDLGRGDEDTYRVVGSLGAGEDMFAITSSSPVGKAIMGRKAGEEALVQAPAGEIRFLIVSIDK